MTTRIECDVAKKILGIFRCCQMFPFRLKRVTRKHLHAAHIASNQKTSFGYSKHEEVIVESGRESYGWNETK